MKAIDTQVDEFLEKAAFVDDAGLKALYRRAAHMFHPDLAADETDRVQRTQQMQQLNAAYQRRDHAAIHGMLNPEPEYEPDEEFPFPEEGDPVEAARRARADARARAEDHEWIPRSQRQTRSPGPDWRPHRHRRGVWVRKAEQTFEDLIKVDPMLAEHLKRIRQVAPDSAKVVSRTLFVDHMVPGVGNKAAYDDFLSRPRQGVHVMMDANDFGAINKQWGQSVGDDAIRHMGGMMRDASRKFGGKLFRVGGDEFRAHFDLPEHAYGFARHLRDQMAGAVPVKGVHRHSVSIGFGHTPEHAEQALIYAKQAKKAMQYQPGQAGTHAHSLLEGSAGPVPLGSPMPQPGFGFHPLKRSERSVTFPSMSKAANRSPEQHDYLWHLTDKPDFKIDPNYRPTEAYGSPRSSQKPGLFLTDDPSYWHPFMDSKPNLWAVRVKPSGPLSRWQDHPQFFDENPGQAQVLEQLPLRDALTRYPKDFRGGSPLDWSYWMERGPYDDRRDDYTWTEHPRPGFEQDHKRYRETIDRIDAYNAKYHPIKPRWR